MSGGSCLGRGGLARPSAALSSVADTPKLLTSRGGTPIASPPSSALQLHAPDPRSPAPKEHRPLWATRSAGHALALSARTTAALTDTVSAVEERGRKAVAVPADLTRPDGPATVVDHAAAFFGGLDIVVHNAGTLPTAEDGSPVMAPFQGSEQAHWDRVIALNLNATAALCRAAHPHLAASDRASLVITSSVAGLVGTPMMEAYAAAFLTGHALVLDGGLAVLDGGLAGIPKPPSPFVA
ncbi:SDR family NAD(P)-dependent oxidoreductase [Streptomyces sp. NPDC094438]|uniref:SDR family NAD(P)-dependent oxidoreductase n=1 Tax=Streptomyces sp. NPDC094438 TaxID=3366061 RepID=UPI0038119BCD